MLEIRIKPLFLWWLANWGDTFSLSTPLLELRHSNSHRIFFRFFFIAKAAKILIVIEFLLDTKEFFIRQHNILPLPVLFDYLGMNSTHVENLLSVICFAPKTESILFLPLGGSVLPMVSNGLLYLFPTAGSISDLLLFSKTTILVNSPKSWENPVGMRCQTLIAAQPIFQERRLQGGVHLEPRGAGFLI
jgi:hypothetical protein